jgi:hypothetical protein
MREHAENKHPKSDLYVSIRGVAWCERQRGGGVRTTRGGPIARSAP